MAKENDKRLLIDGIPALAYFSRRRSFDAGFRRAYAYLIGHDGRISKRVTIMCDDDEEAKRVSRQMVAGHAIELWQEARKIALFELEK